MITTASCPPAPFSLRQVQSNLGALLKCLRANLHVVRDEEVQEVSNWTVWLHPAVLLFTVLSQSHPPAINDPR